MGQHTSTAMWMYASAAQETEAASSCSANGSKCAPRAARMLDTMVMVSNFAILGIVGKVLAVLLLLVGALLIMLARIGRAEAPKRRLLTL